MGSIKIEDATAQRYATAIGRASDQLALRRTVTFSSAITVQGNVSAENQQQSLATALTNAQQMLKRDVANVQTVVAAFERMDQELQKKIESATKDGLQGAFGLGGSF